MADSKAFFAAYDAVLGQWPVKVEAVDIPTPYGRTRTHVSGPEGGTPLVLLPGGGTTSVSWFANAEALAENHRIYAVDLLGDLGHSPNDGLALRSGKDLTAWLDALLDGLGLDSVQLCGHSYGAWTALNYALHAPERVSRLALLDPTGCFAGLRSGYVLRALPMLARPTARRMLAFHRWETGSLPENPLWQEFLAATADAPRPKAIRMRRPRTEDLKASSVETLVLLAGRSKAHDTLQVAATARKLLPHATVTVLEQASHHSLPTEQPAEVNRLLKDFLS
ncbi:alpha/beta hydrolase [Streptomyces sp. YC504]|uniref:Alpha/beta hydrolase n=1 Tax=Streptomyces mesophilus TaxID=1775132 RepID=A0A6G4XDW7_9ACTN|nr:alpha/beta hydrolase [Streptomyces mesophilus]NGO75739.1 alpha/beta hydrolase [Streptomyces mesophilus]